MTDEDYEQLPGLSPQSRAEIFGVTETVQRQDEQREPWLRDWSARHGAAPDHWKTWCAAGRPAPDRSSLCIIGEDAIVDSYRAALARIPDGPAWFACAFAIVVCGGWESTGSLLWLPRLPAAPPGEWRVIALHRADEGIAAHETAHLWQLSPPEFIGRLTAADGEKVRAEAVALTVESPDGEQVIAAMKDQQMLHERAADRLASCWLGRTIDTTAGHRGVSRRRGMDETIARLHDRAIGAAP